MSSGNNHTHNHSHAPSDFGRAFFIGILLNTIFIIAEIIYGIYANSLALLAEAGHNAGDVLGLFMAWGAIILAKRAPSDRYTYGLQSSSIIAALANAVLLLVTCGGIGWEAIQRIIAEPVDTSSTTVMVVAAIGVLVNGVTAWLFMSGIKDDLNIRGAFLHMASDAAISLGIVITSIVMLNTGWTWLDPLASLVISIIIVISTWSLLRDSMDLALHATPKNINISKVKAYITGLKGVKEMHDLHIWAISTTNAALSVHLLMPGGYPGDAFIKEVTDTLEHDFKIVHATIQIEVSGEECNPCT